MRKPNDFTTLQIPSSSSPKEIREAYLQLAKIYHPDKNPQNIDKFKEIQQAYENLKKIEFAKEKIEENLFQEKKKDKRTMDNRGSEGQWDIQMRKIAMDKRRYERQRSHMKIW